MTFYADNKAIRDTKAASFTDDYIPVLAVAAESNGLHLQQQLQEMGNHDNTTITMMPSKNSTTEGTKETSTDYMQASITESSNKSTSSPSTTLSSNQSSVDYNIPSLPQEKNQTQTKLPFCIQGFYGSNCNRMITLAKAMQRANEASTYIRLDDQWTEWYLQFFDPRPGIIELSMQIFHNQTASADKQCLKWFQGKQLYRLVSPQPPQIHRGKQIPMLVRLLPKQSIRDQAEAIVRNMYAHASKQGEGNSTTTHNSTSDGFISVHRRWLEGGCHQSAQNRKLHFRNCTESILRAACDYQYDDIVRHLFSTKPPCANNTTLVDNSTNVTIQTDGNKSTPSIILFTDGEYPQYDDTFPVRDIHDFALQLWMMTLSQQHFGNPISTVDIVVRHWRWNRLQSSASSNVSTSNDDLVHPMACNQIWSKDMK